MNRHRRNVTGSFAKQAPRFENPQLTLANREYLNWMVDMLDLQPEYAVLDVVADTGHLSRASLLQAHTDTES